MSTEAEITGMNMELSDDSGRRGIRTSLTGIVGLLDLLRLENMNDESAFLVQMLEYSVKILVRQLESQLTIGLDPELFVRAEKTDRPNPENKDLSILIIEDDAVNQLFLETILSKRNYSLEIAPDGDEAIEMVSALKPDLVLLDIGLPGKSGLDVAEYMKKNQELKDIPIICITAFRERDIIARLSALRVNKILIKPVNTEKIYAAIDYMF